MESFICGDWNYVNDLCKGGTKIERIRIDLFYETAGREKGSWKEQDRGN